jgi:allophanate hydrolase
MAGLIEVITGGLGNAIQDTGRCGHRHQGLAVSGYLDRPLADCANALVGNPPAAACLELRGLGPQLAVRHGPLRVALAGNVAATILRANGSSQPLPAWQSATLTEQDSLKIGAVAGGTAYLALSGGCAVPRQLGSRSTYQRAGIGGIDGHALQTGDRIPCAQLGQRDYRETRGEPFVHADGPIRVLLGPQAGHFTDDAIATFLNTPYTATAEQDRMGLRLAGPALAHSSPASADIVSDGVTPGAIQVPANGLPIILLADCQTVGGYPKIATVISADLPRLAHCPPGSRLEFQAVDLATAHHALAELRQRWTDWAHGLQHFLPPGSLDEAALYGGNLISGMVRAEP